MNPILKNIKSRRSVRNYKNEQIKDEELERILEAAIYAPTGHNDQPWHFTVIQNKDLINHINEGAKTEMRKMDVEWIARMGAIPGFNIFYNAPTVIIVSGNKNAVTPKVDCSAAVQNMLLAAESMDIGSCWIGFAQFYFITPESKQKFNIPENNDVYYGVSLGYKINKNLNAPKRRTDVFSYFK